MFQMPGMPEIEPTDLREVAEVLKVAPNIALSGVDLDAVARGHEWVRFMAAVMEAAATGDMLAIQSAMRGETNEPERKPAA